MEYRIGKCTKCEAEFKVPASFRHDVARCKVCGGVVRFDGAGAAKAKPAPAAPKPVPARKVASREPAASSSGGSGPAPRKKGSTLERLKAERAAAAAASAAAEGDPIESDPFEGLAGEGPAVESPAIDSGGSDLDLDLDLGVDAPAPEPARKPARRSSTAGRASAAAGAAAAAGAGDGDEAPPRPGAGRAGARGRTSTRRAGSRPRMANKKKSPVPVLAGFGGLAVIAVGLFLFKDSLLGGEDEPDTSSEVAAAGLTPDTEPVAPAPDEPAPDEVDPKAAVPEDAPEDEPAEEEESPFEEPKPEVDPDSVDLTAIADFGMVAGTTPEEWTEMNEWADTWMDIDAGAAGNRAKIKLVEKGRKAFPVILNRFKTLDFATDEGKSNGDQCQRTLMDLVNGNNFGWKYTTEPKDVYFNKKVVVAWANQWERAQDDVEYWIKFAKLEEKDPKEAERLREEHGGAASSSGNDDLFDDTGDLDVD